MDYLKHYDEAPNGCWIWRGATVGQKGYGVIKRQSGIRMAHRYFYETLVGPVPEGLVLDHLCRNRRCVNPAHLEPVTSWVNTMRGETPARENAEKTLCKRGHPLTPYFDARAGKTYRRCMVCNTKPMRRLIQAERRANRAAP
jgi:hypothetical protein